MKFNDRMDYEVLTTLDINNALIKYSIFKGTFPADKVPISRLQETQAFIINTAKDDMSGEHWTALIINKKYCIFFDSFGYELFNIDILTSLKNTGVILYKYNNTQIQPFFSGNCGYYCIAFILSYIQRLTYSEFMNIFSYDMLENNNTCYNFIKMYI